MHTGRSWQGRLRSRLVWGVSWVGLVALSTSVMIDTHRACTWHLAPSPNRAPAS